MTNTRALHGCSRVLTGIAAVAAMTGGLLITTIPAQADEPTLSAIDQPLDAPDVVSATDANISAEIVDEVSADILGLGYEQRIALENTPRKAAEVKIYAPHFSRWRPPQIFSHKNQLHKMAKVYYFRDEPFLWEEKHQPRQVAC
jgi:hypothetical protein